MLPVLTSLAVLLVTGLAALIAHRSPRAATALGAGGAAAGSLLGLVPALGVLLGDPAISLRVPWQVPGGAFSVEIDALSALFLFPIFLLSALAAVYGAGYLWPSRTTRSLGPPWFFYNLLVACMVLVVIARNAVLFLMAWEVMALASFFLVIREHEKEEVREAGWTYLVATRLGTAFLLAFFAWIGRETGSMEFDRFSRHGVFSPALAGSLFVLAVIGFGTKAGFMPLHVWLPEAHPAAPSHVSALMSGVMIKTGIYGLVRTLTWLGPPPAWWAWTLIAIGLSSGILGVLFALAQNDLKRLLAYSSVENIGIITLGLGVGVLGIHTGSTTLAVLGFAGGLLHVVNHALFKGLLFLGAGAVVHATGTREIDRLGGLLKRMPVTAACFLTGAAAISGLPPFNGFVGEFLILLGSFRGASVLPAETAVPLLAAIAGLALIGGLAAACFSRAFGIVFLGEARGEPVAHAHEPGPALRAPMWILAVACVAVGLLGPWVVRALAPALEVVMGTPVASGEEGIPTGPLLGVLLASLLLLATVALSAAIRRFLLAGRPVTESVTWDCGYARPGARMQYTASSYAQPLTSLFSVFLRTRRVAALPEGIFPSGASFATETRDVCRESGFRPAFERLSRVLWAMRWLQHGRVHLYVLYIALTLVVLLVWKLG
ncbi:MAG: oxidoreductase [Planctomycetes bacterium]|nr:oxidoreductase [Planctomycetota bacterium]